MGKIADRTPTQHAEVCAMELGCSYVMLPHGRFALVDTEDLERVSEYLWNTDGRYVCANGPGSAKTRAHLWLHRFITGAPEGMEVDHINLDKFDNRKQNLRVCTRSFNKANCPKPNLVTFSKFKGVTSGRNRLKFYAQGKFSGKKHNLGSFDTEIEAAKAYNQWAVSKFGEFARLNPA